MDTDDDPRTHRMNDAAVREGAEFVLYWMQSSQRADDNAALHLAILEANRLDLPCVAAFALTDGYPSANERHFAFMLEGLADAAARLERLGVRLVGRRGSPVERVAELAARAALVVTDTAYLDPPRTWREDLAKRLEVPLVRVESDVVVPVGLASGKREWAARTIRSKIARHRDDDRFGPVPRLKPKRSSADGTLELDPDDGGRCDLADPEALLADLDVDRSVPRVTRFRGGTGEARRRLKVFVDEILDGYAESRRAAERRGSSELSPYLHFGQIGLGEIVRAVRDAGDGLGEDVSGFLEEVIVRRELARNYTWFERDYDKFSALPDWALKTLAEHRGDDREHVYTRAELEAADTHDEYWNAAMREMVHTGYMHNLLRMYWGKKVLEWTNTPDHAYRTLLYLNDRYFLDGRDPSSYSNVGWVFGLHDTAWAERPVFGKTRYMNANGLKRKFDVPGYLDRVASLVAEEGVEPGAASGKDGGAGGKGGG